MKICVLTLGCKANLSESDEIKRKVVESGMELVSLKDMPDYCIVNTCTVTAKSDYQSRQVIRRALRTGAQVVVTGCYSELKKKEIKDISDEIVIIPNQSKIKDIKDIIHNNHSNTLKNNGRFNFLDIKRSRPFVKVQDGCNYRCTYCNIWMARGRSRSKPSEEVIKEVLQLEEEGYREVVLTGIHIGLYGRDLEGKINLNYLLKKLLLSTSKIRIRLGSLEVNEIDDETIDLLGHERACRHLHIPLQSADDEILKKMGRKYNAGDFFSRTRELRERIPGIAIGADLIVGFPGETDRSFDVTKRRISESEISYLHVFPFSKRPNTRASEMEGQVDERVKRERAATMREISKELKYRFLQSQRGEIIGVLIEESLEDGYIKGKSDNYINVYMKSKVFEQGEIVNAKIDKAFRDGVLGNTIFKQLTY